VKNTKLWEKENGTLDREIEAFTVGKDYLADQKLVKFDCIASTAHAKMLEKNGIITSFEFEQLRKCLAEISDLAGNNEFEIKMQDEDCHTAIENFLVAKLGKTGQKIHSFRSRNDQVMAALRLYMRNEIAQTETTASGLVNELKIFSKKNKKIKMPGYTHMRKAMPSTAGIWASAFAESFCDGIKLLKSCGKLVDQNPLGSAAGYGLPAEINREITTKLLGFNKTQKNPLYCANSRGKFEAIAIFPLSQLMLDINKLATDMLLFSTEEFGYFILPKEFLTGSSLMPQKRNPDALELLRANSHTVQAELFRTLNILSNLPSGYNRDFQLTKEALINAFETTKASLKIAAKVISRLEVDKEKCAQAMAPEIFAAEKALEKTQKGIPFREAYKQTAREFFK